MKYCTKCGAQNADGADFCAACGSSISSGQPLQPPAAGPGAAPPATAAAHPPTVPPKKTGGCAKGCLGVAVAVILLIILAAVFGRSGNSPSEQSSSNGSARHAKSSPTRPANSTTITFTGGRKVEGVTVDDTIYGITDAKITDTIGANEYESGTRASGRFVILTFVVENVSKKTREISLSSSTLTDSQGNTYQSSSEGETALTMTGDKDAEFLLSEVQPNLPIFRKVVYDVPAGERRFTLTIPHGMLSGGEDGKLSVNL